MSGQPRRLDSWKDIADYLGRDVRTAMRWAKSQQLPVRRVGGRGRSVFAFTDEIDLWLAGNPPAHGSEPTGDSTPIPEADAPLLPPAPEAHGPSHRRGIWYVGGVAATGAAVMLSVAGLPWLRGAEADPAPRVDATELAVTVTPRGAPPREIHRFAVDLPPVITLAPPLLHDADGDGTRDALAGVAYYIDKHHRTPRSGELINLSLDGGARWRFTFDDVLAFRHERFDGPWGVTDWSVGPQTPTAKIAVSAHHHTWWASMAAVLDHTGKRLTTFVHPGWIESLLWLDERRVAAAGFTNARDAAMMAVIDAGGPDTHAPPSGNAAYLCEACTHSTPMFYASFPRSELNVASTSRFNRARVSRRNDRIIVQTVEVDGDPISATVIYEFDKDLKLLRASYDDGYWTIHARLEFEGRLSHTRAACPDRDGPPPVSVWRAGSGWTTASPGGAAQ